VETKHAANRGQAGFKDDNIQKMNCQGGGVKRVLLFRDNVTV